MRELDPLTFLVAEALLGSQSCGLHHAAPAARPLAGSVAPIAGHCLILLAHGSNDPRWRAPFQRIALELEQDLGRGKVRLAYMEFIGPTLMEVVRECVGQTVLNLRVLPLFMAAGGHLAKDIPEQVEEVRRQFPQ